MHPRPWARWRGATSIPGRHGRTSDHAGSSSQPALDNGAAILQPALGRAGGIWEARKIAVLAEAKGAQMAPHLYAGPLEWAANIQLCVAIPNLLIAETIETPFHDALIKGSIQVEEGFIPLQRRRAWGSRWTRTWRARIPGRDRSASGDAGGPATL